jgi:tetratricopeptide (TPR) repeat protein
MPKEAAEIGIEEALKRNPRQPGVWCALGDARLHSQKFDEARAAFENALRLDEGLAQAHFGLGLISKQLGKIEEAIAHYWTGLDCAPQHDQALLDLGVLLAERNQTKEAVGCWQRILERNPEHAQAHHNLGVAMAQMGNPDEAIRLLKKAIALRPSYSEAFFNLANVLCNQKSRDNDRRQEGVDRYREAVRLQTNYIEAIYNLGSVLTDLDRPAEAELWLRQAVRIGLAGQLDSRSKRDDSRFHLLTPSVFNQLGVALCAQGKYRAARSAYRRALAIKPDFSEAHCNLANLYQELGRLPEALTCYELALLHEPQSAVTKWNRALSFLQSGDFVTGWREYEWRWQRPQTPPRPIKEPRWDGTDLHGKTLLIHMEQGLGDMIQFIRFAPLAKERGARVLVECPGFAVPLLARCPGVDEIIPEGIIRDQEPLPGAPRFDMQIPIMSLPHVLGITLSNLPSEVPYIHLDESRVLAWRDRLAKEIEPPSKQELRAGICWQGNPNHRLDRYRSIPLADFAPLARIPGVRLVSLQKGPGAAQLLTLPSTCPIWEPPHSAQMTAEALLDTAALMKNLDLIVSVDTGTAHLAGALGMPVWVPLSAVGEWRWLLHREDSPWYPTMRLFRQKRLGRWHAVFRRIVHELEKTVAAPERIKKN